MSSSLRDVDFPPEFKFCSHGSCNIAGHKIVLDGLYDKIVNVLCNAAIQTNNMCTNKPYRKNKVLYGWNKHVREAHRDARLRFKVWVLHNRPSSGLICQQMNESRKIYKGRLKWCQKN